MVAKAARLMKLKEFSASGMTRLIHPSMGVHDKDEQRFSLFEGYPMLIPPGN
jgi:hypothetical protein